MSKTKAVVALSGGVDSAIAAWLLKNDGFDVTGIHMKRYDFSRSAGNNESSKYAWVEDEAEIERICRFIDISYITVDLENEFQHYVIDYFSREYGRGRTPNPCIECNRYMKFGFLFDRAMETGADYFVTGHYAKISFYDDCYHLQKGKDGKKDQSYVLYRLDQQRLGRILFPLGEYYKNHVISLANEIGMRVSPGSGSQDLCFADDGYGAFLSGHYPKRPGNIVDNSGTILGRHDGVIYYTVGQRRRLGIASEKRLYVTEINPGSNTVMVGDESELYNRDLEVRDVNWISGNAPPGSFEGMVKIRYKSKEAEAVIYPEKESIRVCFNKAQRAITPGQAAVFYHDDEVTGGGTIERVW
ncbi:MAG: tRNA 2-thiouridine(34) synthase MnmA [Dehalococcoidia bacterium]